MTDTTARSLRSVDAARLAARVRARREGRGLSLRGAAKELGMSAATISRVESGAHLPERDHLLRLIDWVDVERTSQLDVAHGDVHAPDAGTFEAVELHLRADKDLKPDDADLLVQILRTAYLKMSQRSD